MPTNQKTTSNKRQREQDQKDRAAERIARRNERKVRAAARLASGLVGPQIAEPSPPEGEAALDRDPAPVARSSTLVDSRARSGERPPGTARRLYVGNLAYDMDADSIRSLFARHGEVSDVHVVLDQVSRRSRGFAFVTMGSPAEAQGAMNELDGQIIDGRTLRVSEAEEREPRAGGARPGAGGGRY